MISFLQCIIFELISYSEFILVVKLDQMDQKAFLISFRIQFTA